MKRVYRKPNPHLFDVAIDEIQTALNNECAWLNNIFGRCERLVKEINGRKEFTANWYKAKNDYILIAPDEGLGNFCFFVLDEPTDLENYFAGDVTRSTIGFSLIVWCDLRTIGEGRDTEAIKEELLQILNGRTHLRSGRMTIDKVYERAENIFREFDYDEIDNQFLMHPFAGFRIEGELIVDTLCDAYIPPTPPVEPPTFEIWANEKIDTFSFVVNENETITIPVINYYGRWVVDRPITSLKGAFANNTMWKEIKIKGLKLNFSLYAFAERCGTNFRHYIDISECELATTNYFYFSGSTLATLFLPIINYNLYGMVSGVSNAIATNQVLSNVNLSSVSGETKEGVLSFINNAANNNTYTLHPAVYAKCASSGEWNADVQAAIDAKAAQGYVVTLISA